MTDNYPKWITVRMKMPTGTAVWERVVELTDEEAERRFMAETILAKSELEFTSEPPTQMEEI